MAAEYRFEGATKDEEEVARIKRACELDRRPTRNFVYVAVMERVEAIEQQHGLTSEVAAMAKASRDDKQAI